MYNFLHTSLAFPPLFYCFALSRRFRRFLANLIVHLIVRLPPDAYKPQLFISAWQHSNNNDATAPNADEGWANHGRSPSPARNGGGDREMKDMTREGRDAGARERRSRSRSPVRREDRPDRGRLVPLVPVPVVPWLINQS